MSDLFHVDVPVEYIRQVFDVMARAHWHRFQVLTKRADRLRELGRVLDGRADVHVLELTRDAVEVSSKFLVGHCHLPPERDDAIIVISSGKGT